MESFPPLEPEKIVEFLEHSADEQDIFPEENVPKGRKFYLTETYELPWFVGIIRLPVDLEERKIFALVEITGQTELSEFQVFADEEGIPYIQVPFGKQDHCIFLEP